MDKKEGDSLNDLLEDALQDLLLDDGPPEETKGQPNIEESLKKISKVTKAQTSETTITSTSKQGQQQGSSKGNKKPESKQAGSSKGNHNKVIDEDEMNRFFASMTEQLKNEMPRIDPEEAQARINESVPQIFDLMGNLLSKELLYPAMRNLAPKFDEWLKKNEDSLCKGERKRYKEQLKKINEIIDVFDDESLDDHERFQRNLELMEQMQSLGAPPEF